MPNNKTIVVRINLVISALFVIYVFTAMQFAFAVSKQVSKPQSAPVKDLGKIISSSEIKSKPVYAQAFGRTSVDQALKDMYGVDNYTISHKVVVKAPYIAENRRQIGLMVMSSIKNVDSISVFVLKRNNPLIASYELNKKASAYVRLRIRLNRTRTLLVVLRSGGKLYAKKVEVKVTGRHFSRNKNDCKNYRPNRQRKFKDKFRLRNRSYVFGDLVFSKYILSHLMSEPIQGDLECEGDEGNYIKDVVFKVNGEIMIRAHWSPAISKNPFMAILFAQNNPYQTFTVLVRDNHMQTRQYQISPKGPYRTFMQRMLSSSYYNQFRSLLKDHLHFATIIRTRKNVNQRNRAGDTLLFDTVTIGDLKEVKSLIHKGAKFNILNQRGQTPLMLAVDFKRGNIVHYLLKQGANPNLGKPGIVTPLTRSILNQSVNITHALLSSGANINQPSDIDKARINYRLRKIPVKGITAFQAAAWSGDIGVLKTLINLKVNRFAQDQDGCTAICYAAAVGQGDVLKYLFSESLKLPKRKRAKQKFIDYFRDFLVHTWKNKPKVTERGMMELLQLLETQGMNFNDKGSDGKTTLESLCAQLQKYKYYRITSSDRSVFNFLIKRASKQSGVLKRIKRKTPRCLGSS